MTSPPGVGDPPWQGGRWSSRAWCQLCPNPSPMTLEGTNTWVVGEPGSGESVVIDPGPLDEAHLQAVLARVAEADSRVSLTLLTHRHEDHAGSAGRFAALTGSPVRAVGTGHDDLADGDRLRVAGVDLVVVATPGHTGDSVSFLLPGEQLLFTGDTILGRGTTVVAHPDGRLSAYLESLQRLQRMSGSGAVTSVAPGHGPGVPDAAAVVEHYVQHRAERLDQVREAVERIRGRPGGRSADLADAVVREVYAEVPPQVWPAARLSVLAQLEYLDLA